MINEVIAYQEDGDPLHSITISSLVMSANLSLSVQMKCRSMFYDRSRCQHAGVLYVSLLIVT